MTRPCLTRRRGDLAPRARDESSNSFAMFVIMIPLLMGAFGMGLDISRNVFIRTELQNGLDLAVVGGAAEVQFAPNGAAVVDLEKAVVATERVYNMNRAEAAALLCTKGQGLLADSGITRCWQPVDPHTYTDINKATGVASSGYYYAVRERSRNAFLSVVGVTYQDYLIESRASIRQAAQ